MKEVDSMESNLWHGHPMSSHPRALDLEGLHVSKCSKECRKRGVFWMLRTLTLSCCQLGLLLFFITSICLTSHHGKLLLWIFGSKKSVDQKDKTYVHCMLCMFVSRTSWSTWCVRLTHLICLLTWDFNDAVQHAWAVLISSDWYF